MMRAIGAVLACLLTLSACAGNGNERVDPDQVDSVEVPELGACRMLLPEDVAQPSNATRTVDCRQPHTAETYAIGQLPTRFDDADYDDERLSDFAYRTCSQKFERFLGADESLVMRTILSWAWFRPSEEAWDDGARWYRCDIVGGVEQAEEYVELPTTAKGLLLGKPHDRWMVCAQGAKANSGAKVPCSEPHDWRAVTTIKVGLPNEPYPGDRLVEVKSKEFCGRSVQAWMNYPLQYDFAFTFFHEAEWEVGNRRSICWAKTAE